MRALRGVQPIVKVAIVFLLALSTSLAFTLLHPRSAHAEGFLLDTVRCLVRTVLVDRCRGAEVPPSTAAPTTPSNTKESSSGSRSSASDSGAPQPRQQQLPVVYSEPLALPDATAADYPELQQVSWGEAVGEGRLSGAEYVAYFNKYHYYAAENERTVANGGAIVQAGPEGWKLFGVAWYWWGLAVVALGGIFASVRQRNLRNHSVLSK